MIEAGRRPHPMIAGSSEAATRWMRTSRAAAEYQSFGGSTTVTSWALCLLDHLVGDRPKVDVDLGALAGLSSSSFVGLLDSARQPATLALRFESANASRRILSFFNRGEAICVPPRRRPGEMRDRFGV